MGLFGVDSRLYDMLHVEINDRLYELISDKDPILRERYETAQKENGLQKVIY